MDEQLWSFRPDAFLPHSLHQSKPNDVIVCGWEEDPSPHQDLLVNLSNDTPAFFSRFKPRSTVSPRFNRIWITPTHPLRAALQILLPKPASGLLGRIH